MFQIETKTDGRRIMQTVSIRSINDDHFDIVRQNVVDTLDEQFIEALKSIGWTPPPERNQNERHMA